ncbi:sphingosine 1-phosphate receptor 4 [Amia ocellicauda]|uniref:sphingosine 1-phosphate receptor 4 n=1 Tax=Amia ocellicauda TaxID=2972642 RepID=UPI003463AFEE|nr:S1PR4 protein [Amia calva]
MEILHSLNSPSSCPETYSWTNGNVILEHYNYTGRLENRHRDNRSFSGVKVAFTFISTCIILENLIVLLAVLVHLRFRSWVYICIVNITLSDLLAGVAYVVNLFLSGRMTFQLTPNVWLFREGVLFVALAASIFSLLLTAVERYVTMMNPTLYKSTSKSCRVYTLAALCWVAAFIIGFLPLLGWNCLCNLENCSTLLPLYSKSYILFCVVMFSLILAGIWFLYYSIYRHVKTSTEKSSTRSRTKSFRLLKTVVLIVGAFVVCWGPLFCLLLMDAFCSSAKCSQLYSMDWPIALAVLNSAINPIIYSFGSMDVRKAIVNILCCCCFKTGLCDIASIMSVETGNSSESSLRHNSIRNSFRRASSLSPTPSTKTKKIRLSSTTSCLSVSSC